MCEACEDVLVWGQFEVLLFFIFCSNPLPAEKSCPNMCDLCDQAPTSGATPRVPCYDRQISGACALQERGKEHVNSTNREARKAFPCGIQHVDLFARQVPACD